MTAAKKTAKSKATGRKAPRVAKGRPGIVVIGRPTSAEETRKAFGIGARRWKRIQALVDEVVDA